MWAGQEQASYKQVNVFKVELETYETFTLATGLMRILLGPRSPRMYAHYYISKQCYCVSLKAAVYKSVLHTKSRVEKKYLTLEALLSSLKLCYSTLMLLHDECWVCPSPSLSLSWSAPNLLWHRVRLNLLCLFENLSKFKYFSDVSVLMKTQHKLYAD